MSQQKRYLTFMDICKGPVRSDRWLININMWLLSVVSVEVAEIMMHLKDSDRYLRLLLEL
jgi:hypothetical protein